MIGALIALSVLASGTVVYLMIEMKAKKAPAADELVASAPGVYASVGPGPGVGYVDSASDLESGDGDGDGKARRWRE